MHRLVQLSSPARCSRRFSAQTPSAVRTLQRIADIFTAEGATKALAFHESRFDPRTMTLQQYAGAPYEARDVVLLLFKAHSEADRIDAARLLLHIALRDLPPRHVNASIFEGYLQAIASSSAFSRNEVFWAMDEMKRRGIAITEKIYLSLAEVHVRMDVEPRGVWVEIWDKFQEQLRQHGEAAATPPLLGILHSPKGSGDNESALQVGGVPFGASAAPLTPSLALTKMVLLQSAINHSDFQYSLTVVRHMLRLSPIDRSLLARYFVSAVGAPDVSTEQAQWLLFELEQRCVFARTPLTKHVQQRDLIRLLLKCAQSSDADAAERVLAAMERHLMPKTADVLALMIWAYAAAGNIPKAFDAVELMARKGLLDHTDPFKRFTVEAIGYTLDRHFLMTLAESLHKPALADQAYFYLERRFAEKKSVTVHSLDVIVLACSKLGDDTRAAETVESYGNFDLQPRTETYNNLLLACIGRSKAKQHRTVFDAMIKNGVRPNQQTFRLLIRQAVLSDNIEEAIAFLKKVPTINNLRVEVEMLLPIVERASRVGDIDTVVQMVRFSLDCDIGIDTAVLDTICKNLKKLGVETAAVEELLPLHEKLRNRSKFSRRRTRSEP